MQQPSIPILDRWARLLYGSVEDTGAMSPAERLRNHTLGGTRVYVATLLGLIALFTLPTFVLAPDAALYNGIARAVVSLGMVIGLRTAMQDGYRGAGDTIASAALVGISAMVLVEVAMSGAQNHPFLFAPVFFVAALALFVPIEPRAFLRIGLIVAALPLPLLALQIIPVDLQGAGIYLMFSLPAAVLGALAVGNRREDFLAQCEAEQVQRENSDRLRDTLRALGKAQQQLLSADRMALLGELASGIAGELDVPLQSARDGIDETRLLYEGLESEPRMDAARAHIEGALDYLGELSRQTQNLGWAQKRKFDVVREVKGAVKLMRWRADRSGIPLVVDGMMGLEMTGDPGKLAQVLATLIDFAIKRSETTQDGAKIGVEVSLHEEGIIIRVSDRGPVIPEEVAEHIFEPAGVRNPGERGTGLELSICRAIVVGAFGGKLRLEQPPEGGATFAVVVPPERPEMPDPIEI